MNGPQVFTIASSKNDTLKNKTITVSDIPGFVTSHVQIHFHMTCPTVFDFLSFKDMATENLRVMNPKQRLR